MAFGKAKPAVDDGTDAPIRFKCGGCGHGLRARTRSAGKKVKCPRCDQPTDVPLPGPQANDAATAAEPNEVIPKVEPIPEQTRFRLRIMPAIAVFVVTLVLLGCSAYANLAFAVTDRVHFKYFPPFKAYVNRNDNRHLGAEYLNIAKALLKGRGFADPFREETGPTAWMPPVLPALLAGLLWVCDNNTDAVMTVCLILHVAVLIATGNLVLALAWQTTSRLGVLVGAAIFLTAVIADFRMWFQTTHDTSLVLLALDVVLAGLAWGRPLDSWPRAVGWGLAGGACGMVNPIVGLAWGVASIAEMVRQRAWGRFGIVLACAIAVLTPWTIRNYIMFGRLIPVKSNAAYELWQSQCVQKDGLLHHFNGHPYGGPGRERRLYKEMGEMKFIDEKRNLFWQAVKADPLDFADRVAARLLGATLWYEPFDSSEKREQPVVFWLSRVWHPLPFLALSFLALTAMFRPLAWSQWLVMGAYVIYISPYIAISYYERYAMPLLAAKVLLIIWAADRLLCFIRPPKPSGRQPRRPAGTALLPPGQR